MVVADMPSDYATYDQDKEQVKGQALSARNEEPEEVEKEVAIKVTLPTIFVMHVQNMLNRRGGKTRPSHYPLLGADCGYPQYVSTCCCSGRADHRGYIGCCQGGQVALSRWPGANLCMRRSQDPAPRSECAKPSFFRRDRRRRKPARPAGRVCESSAFCDLHR